ncbi:sensor histidine kinase [Paenibacillus mucilaginosus]|uniref:sensor histidine kinase n=1 Tax=Paenibacillus mucilaginosus TaxID=61624 RepID=UPI001EEF9028|nr:HAMP domain-containing sensor histidine kinase [Paenibacillus mucilaginosus]MCG7212949.1 HAMP domain-containing histidine kinase [Paenibacillus mucilaginosus]WDM26638.1 HAMP domain-containing histidine kinase [Paenibacillus mucilaginosus]
MSKPVKIKKPRKPVLDRFPFRLFPFTLLRGFLLFLADLYKMAKVQVERSVRLQLVLTFGVCLLASLIFYSISSAIFGQINKGTVIDYSVGIDRIDSEARGLIRLLEPVQDDEELEEPEGGSEESVTSEAVQPGTSGAGAGAAATAGTPGAAGTQAASAIGAAGAAGVASGQSAGAAAAAGTMAAVPAAPGTVTAPAGAAGSASVQAAPTAPGAVSAPAGAAGAASVQAAPTAPGAVSAPAGAAGSASVQAAPTAPSAVSAPAAGSAGTVPAVPAAPAVPPAAVVPGTPTDAEQRERDAEDQRRRLEQQERNKRQFLNTVKQLAANENYKTVITDLEGRVVFRSENAPETYVDVHSVIRNAMNARNSSDDSRTEFSSFYPVTYNNQKSYLIVTGIPQPVISYRKGTSPLSMLSAFAVFIFLFYYLTQRKMRYIEELAGGLRIIATGNLDHRVIERSNDELGSLAKDMNQMVADLQHRIEEERRSERSKNELITNVSHDLRTPLTLIMGYLKLLHDRNYESPEQAAGYVGIAYSKAEKLRGLIEDLFEYTKYSSQEVPLYKKGVILNEVLEQLLEEYVTLSEEQQLTLIRSLPQERLPVRVDVEKIIRVFENLLGNAVKYSPKPGVISVGMAKDRGWAVVRISNKADALTRDQLEQLFDRFYRVDAARNSSSGGTGLGLAIAKSIVESHGGSIWAESDQGDIHFYVKLKLQE